MVDQAQKETDAEVIVCGISAAGGTIGSIIRVDRQASS